MTVAVIEDDDGVSKGYGFVRFTDEADRNRCYAELDRAMGLGKKPITIKPAFAPKTRSVLRCSYICDLFSAILFSWYRQNILFIFGEGGLIIKFLFVVHLTQCDA